MAILAPSLKDLSSLPDSRYVAEQRRIAEGRPFSSEFEREFLAARLLKDRTLIRASACLALLVVATRIFAQSVNGTARGLLLIEAVVVAAGSLALVWLSFGPAFERHYLRWAELIVPARNTLGAAYFAAAAALGRVELFMVMPILILGPFFFAGLRYGAALACGVMSVSAFVITSALVMPHAVAMRCGAYLLITLVGSAIVARNLEKSARATFIERYLIEELAQRDALTGARNRRSFDEHLSRIWSEAARDHQTIAVLLIDVDHFKAYNDRYGHLAGDDALRAVARAVQNFTRGPGDILARYGGEEFAAILQGTDGAQAKVIAESMRRAVMDLGLEHRGSRTSESVTISIGIAALEPSLARDSRGAVQLADQALYQAKVKGRNAVELLDQAEYRLLTTGVFRAVGLHTMNDEEGPPRLEASGERRWGGRSRVG